ncbi:MAG: efflux RND transporter periplasmic adaptor subunit, partial [Polyangiaceae bacterium]
MSGKKKLNRGLVLVALAAGIAPACSKSSTSGGAAPAASGKGAHGAGGGVQFPVEVAPVDFRQVGYVITAPGSINAFEQVQVTARVAGAVDKVSFTEGASVKEGQVLVSIESERYQVAVDQAKAALSKTQAAEANAESQLARRTGATADHPGLITGEEIATYQTQVQTAKADVAAANEQVKVAQLNLRDSYVRAPITGVIQTRTVETGQYLQAGNVLATLLQRDPLLLKFQVTEQDAPRVKVGMTATLTMRETTNSYQGTISLVAASADPASHLVPVTATVDDKEHKYWLRPGAFCDVSVPVGGTRPAAVVPESAVRPSENGFLAYVIQGTTAKQRILQLS